MHKNPKGIISTATTSVKPEKTVIAKKEETPMKENIPNKGEENQQAGWTKYDNYSQNDSQNEWENPKLRTKSQKHK